jgi:pyrimidine deaminase RibD-like protein
MADDIDGTGLFKSQNVLVLIEHSTAVDKHLEFMKLALAEAEKCTPTETAFCVGCALVYRPPSSPAQPIILSTGFSRELEGNTHAEANALAKFRTLSPEALPASLSNKTDILSHADVYTTMEPCSVRTSGLPPCADALVAAGVRRCYIGVGEPDDFVQCEGAQRLKDAGVEVHWVKGLEDDCLRIARRGHTQA